MSYFPTWRVFADSLRSDFYDTVYIAGQDITNYVTSMKMKRGMDKLRQRVADPCTMELSIWDYVDENASGRIYNPEDVISIVPRGTFIYVTAEYASVTYGVFKGMVTEVSPNPSNFWTQIKVVGRLMNLNNPVTIPTLIDATSDELIANAVTAARLRDRPARWDDPIQTPYEFWNMSPDDSLYGGLDNYVVAEGIGDYTGGASDVNSQQNYDYQTGKTTFPYVADRYISVPARRVVEDAVYAEIGWFYEDTNGAFRFHNRHDTIIKTTPDATYTLSDLVGYNHAYGLGFRNQVRMPYEARKTVTGATLWTSVAEIRFPSGDSINTIKTLGSDGRAVGLLDRPEPINWAFTGSRTGAAITCKVAAAPVGAGAAVTVRNPSSETAILTIGASLQGTAVIADNPTEIIATDWNSVAQYGLQSEVFELRLADSAETASAIANVLMRLDSMPGGVLTYIEIENDTSAHLIEQLGRQILDLIRVQMDTIFHDQTYLITGIEHTVTMSGQKIVTRFYLQKQRVGALWLLDVVGAAELDRTTYLGY